MIIIRVNRTTISSVRNEILTSGQIGNQLKMEFDLSWADLNKTVVFNGSHYRVDVNVPDDDSVVTIPYECLSRYGGHLEIGIYGYTVDENNVATIVIPTVYYDLGEIVEGASLSGTSPSTPDVSPTPPGGGDGGSIDDLTFSATVDDTVGTPAVTVTQTGTSVEFAFSGLKGEQGADGESTVSDTIDWSNVQNKPTIPTALSELTDDATHRVVTDTEKSSWDDKYVLPATGMPLTDLAASIQTSLAKADSALQEHQSLSAYRTSAEQDVIDATFQPRITYGTEEPTGGSVGDVYIKITE